ncbi:MAG: hypothetical protein ACE5GW_08955, partial [Planctomycetota bacterium]
MIRREPEKAHRSRGVLAGSGDHSPRKRGDRGPPGRADSGGGAPPHLFLVDPADGRRLRFQEEVEGESIDQVLRQAHGDLGTFWNGRVPGGIGGVVRGFAALAHLAAELCEEGIEVTLDHPRRIFLSRDGRFLLRAADLLEEQHPTSAGSGAPYLPPEILLAPAPRRRPSEPSLVYSLAAILFHALSGSPPRIGRSPEEIADRILAGEALPALGRALEVPCGLEAFLRDCLSFDPERRPRNLHGFALALESALRGGRPRAVPAHLRHQRLAPDRRVLLPLLGIAVIACFAWLHLSGRAQDRLDLCRRLEAALFSRPFPVHGEDPP